MPIWDKVLHKMSVMFISGSPQRIEGNPNTEHQCSVGRRGNDGGPDANGLIGIPDTQGLMSIPPAWAIAGIVPQMSCGALTPAVVSVRASTPADVK